MGSAKTTYENKFEERVKLVTGQGVYTPPPTAKITKFEMDARYKAPFREIKVSLECLTCGTEHVTKFDLLLDAEATVAMSLKLLGRVTTTRQQVGWNLRYTCDTCGWPHVHVDWSPLRKVLYPSG